MKGTGAGWDSILYRVYIIGGLIGVVAVTIGTVIFFDPDGRTMWPVYAGGGCVTLFLLGILGYWWVQILFADYSNITRLPAETDGNVPEISALKSWSTLFDAMVRHGGNPDALKASQRKSSRPMLEWFGWATTLALFPLINVWLYLLELISQEFFLAYIRPAIVIIAVLMLVRTYFLFKRSNQTNEEVIFAPLGLSLVQKSRAGTVLEGWRNGRDVRITINGSHCITQVGGSVSNLVVETDDGKFLLTEDLQQKVYASLKSLRKAKRWAGVKLAGGADGIIVERTARGLNLWLYDLWLAERVLEAHN